MRQILLLIRGIGFLTAALVLGGLAYLAYSTATPSNGQLLISGVLAILAVLALLSIPTRAIEQELAPRRQDPMSDGQGGIPVSFQFGRRDASRSGLVASGVIPLSAIKDAPTSVQFAEPEVHQIDLPMLEGASRMAAEGASIDDICR